MEMGGEGDGMGRGEGRRCMGRAESMVEVDREQGGPKEKLKPIHFPYQEVRPDMITKSAERIIIRNDKKLKISPFVPVPRPRPRPPPAF